MKKKGPVDKRILAQLLSEAVEKLSQDECCPQEIQDDVPVVSEAVETKRAMTPK